jgi:hypothetical protein
MRKVRRMSSSIRTSLERGIASEACAEARRCGVAARVTAPDFAAPCHRTVLALSFAEAARALADGRPGKDEPPACTRIDAVREPAALFDQHVLERILTAADVDALLVDRGRVVGHHAQARANATGVLGTGTSIVVRRAEAHDDALRTLADVSGTQLGGMAHVQLFATPAAARSFGWHYDLEDVFILQVAGTKEYWFRANTLDPGAGAAQFDRIRDETSPRYVTTLAPGDALFLPQRTWHVARAVTASWSVSLGIAR